MEKRRWKRSGRVYRFNSDSGQSIIFRAENTSFWKWGVWGHKFSAQGIEWSLKRAKEKANANLDRLSDPRVTEASA